MPDILLTVTDKRHLTDRICEFTLSGDGPLPDWMPGAHVRVSTEAGERAYSLIRWNEDNQGPEHLKIAVQLEPEGTGGSSAMHALQQGDRLQVSDPKCDFPLTKGRSAVFLAGGIGVTPMISMATALEGKGTPFDLHYAVRELGLAAYTDALVARFGSSVHIHPDNTSQKLNLSEVVSAVGQDRHLYICGPRGLIDAARAAADAAGIEADRVHVELFDNDRSASGDSFEVEISATGQVFTVPPDQSIIEALEAGGIDLVYDCQRGDCGICQTDVISGVPDHRDVVLSEAEKAEGKLMQICVSRAKSPRLVLDL